MGGLGSPEEPNCVRLNRYLSLCGLGSRRGCEQLIADGQVAINGSYTRSLGTQVSDDDEVRVNGRVVKPSKGVVLAIHKPRGYVCSRGDTHQRSTIYDLLPAKYQTLHHVGRLDKESEGLLLMTNRGDLSHRLLHPSQGVEKEYEVVLDQPMDATLYPKLIKGMMTAEGFAKAERVWSGGSDYRIHIVLKQGLKRQIRHMIYTLGFEVERLIRVRIGWLGLRGLAKGGWKELTETEVARFFVDNSAGKTVVRKSLPPPTLEAKPKKSSAPPSTAPRKRPSKPPAHRAGKSRTEENRPSQKPRPSPPASKRRSSAPRSAGKRPPR